MESNGAVETGAGRRELDWVQRFYGVFAPFYDGFRWLWSALTAPAERALDGLFAERIRAGSRVLELGVGTGINIERLRREAPDFGSYLGIDASGAMLERARQKSAGDARIALRTGDATDLSELPGPFDFVVSTWMISHLDDPRVAVARAIEKLSPGGTAAFLAFTTPQGPLWRGVLRLGARIFKARFVERSVLSGLPPLETIRSCAGGMATLAVYRRGPEPVSPPSESC